MDFGLSEEQRLLEDTLRRYLAEHVPAKRVRELMATGTAHDAELWSGLAELGAAGVLIPAEHGGSELTLLDGVLISQALGWGATPAPFLSSGVLAPVALLEAGTPAQQKEWLPELAAGRACIGVALSETVVRREDAGVRLEAGRLHGKALFAIDSGAADAFLVAAGPRDLLLVERDAAGLSLENLSTVDLTRRVAALVFDAVEPVDAVGGPGGGGAAIERTLDAGRLALAADILGACDRALDMSVEYAKERKQFGRVIGSFQAVKHMCAEMAAELEPARSLLWYAAHAFDFVPEDAAKMAALAKAHLAEVGSWLVRSATEVHGGIGFTDEHDLHLWFKRVGLDRHLLGSPERMRERAARLEGWVPASGGGDES
jgi:alkylation response protein AidB-like acyl-CoA dehydrogenase